VAVHRFLPLAALALLAQSAEAQIIRVPKNTSGEPAFWGSAAIGLLQLQAIDDGRSQSRWDFGSAVQYRASLEYAISRGNSVGVSGTFSRAPMTYRAFSVPVPLPGGGSCLDCDAKADVTSLAATFHAGGGLGFHQVIELSAGALMYRNFKTDDGEELPPERDTDFTFALGYGFGYTVNRTFQINLVQDAVLGVHQKEGLSGNARTTNQQYVTRLGVRFGGGSRRGL
jgi:hypothetical protein